MKNINVHEAFEAAKLLPTPITMTLTAAQVAVVIQALSDTYHDTMTDYTEEERETIKSAALRIGAHTIEAQVREAISILTNGQMNGTIKVNVE